MPKTGNNLLDRLPQEFRQRLISMYAGETQLGSAGMVAIDTGTRILQDQGMWIFDTCQKLRPRRTLEVGFAYGFSTIYILAALYQCGVGQHTAIDPFQTDQWQGVGARHVGELGMQQSFRLIEESSFSALGALGAQKERFELIFIDGNHRFDDVLVDFTLAAQICSIGGHIILDDTWMPSIQTVASWIRTNHSDFREVRTPIERIVHFEKIKEDDRNWDHFVDPWPLKNRLFKSIAFRIKKVVP
jgi:predicted O-methyltransferase YrrM